MLIVDKSSLPPSDFCVAIQKNNKVCGRNNCKLHKAKMIVQKQKLQEQELINDLLEKEKNKVLEEKNFLEKVKIATASYSLGYFNQPVKLKF